MRTLAALPLLVVILGFTCGCAVGPNYKRPAVNVPSVYRGLAPEETRTSDARSLADEKWWDVFQDEQLKELIKTALQQNYDLRRAGARILQAQAALGITRSNQFPTISADTSALNERTARQKFIPAIETNTNRVSVGVGNNNSNSDRDPIFAALSPDCTPDYACAGQIHMVATWKKSVAKAITMTISRMTTPTLAQYCSSSRSSSR